MKFQAMVNIVLDHDLRYMRKCSVVTDFLVSKPSHNSKMKVHLEILANSTQKMWFWIHGNKFSFT